MLRGIATLILLTTLVDISNACPWWCNRRSPRPAVVYYYYPAPEPVVVAPPVPPVKKADSFDAEAIYEKAVGSCVYIVTPLKGGFVEGSGALIDSDKRLVITTHRTVDESDVVFVQFPVRLKDGYVMTDRDKYLERVPKGQAVKGKVLHRDKTRNLALVQLDRIPANTPALRLAPSSVQVGDWVMHIGKTHTASKQLFATNLHKVQSVAVRHLAVPVAGIVLNITRWLVTTAPAEGDSGGPLIDWRGHLIAISEGDALGVAARDVNLSLDVIEVRGFLDEFNLERAAADALRAAKLFAQGEDNRPFYVDKLRKLIAKYPGTVAAREAQKALDGIK